MRLAAPDCSLPLRSKQERGLVPNVANIPRAPLLPKNLTAKSHGNAVSVDEKTQISAGLRLAVHEQHVKPSFGEAQIHSTLGPPKNQMAQRVSTDHEQARENEKRTSADV